MDDFADILISACSGKTAFLCIGNPDRGDDGLGMVLASLLRDSGVPNVYDGGTTPERKIPAIRDGGFDSVLFIDAVDVGAEPGSVTILDAQEIAGRYPQISTHKLSLGTLARLLSDTRECRIRLLGIQPATIEFGAPGLSQEIDTMVHELARQIAMIVAAAHEERICI
jgi:hydrogenase 3 maturation protease